MTLGELLEQVSIKLAGIGLSVDEATTAVSGGSVIAGLIARHGHDALIEDLITEQDLPAEMPATDIVRMILSLPLQRDMPPEDVWDLTRLAILLAQIERFLDRNDLVSTAHGPIPRNRLN